MSVLRRTIIVISTIGLAGLAFTGVSFADDPAASGMSVVAVQQDLDCADFGSQAEAQATLDADPSDPHRLDADNDGIACEDGTPAPPPNGTPPTTTTTTPPTDGGDDGTTNGGDDQQVVPPAGGVDTGGRSDDGGDEGLLALGGLVLVGAGAVFVARRRAQGGTGA
ncbi:excalibur calcium-binding domain-containing protein [Prauserella oleivorans]|uniref:Excalibur calcium-binding domain-containing protein n=1 Tax=Prauserella oleivorans TaxID=1478153 RepID=A0ABW5WIV3_9PSEU